MCAHPSSAVFLAVCLLAACGPSGGTVPRSPVGEAAVPEGQRPAPTGHAPADVEAALALVRADLLDAGALTTAFTAAGNPRPLTTTDGALSPAGVVARQRLVDAHLDGLDPKLYHTEALTDPAKTAADTAQELLLIDGLLRYARDMSPAPDALDVPAMTSDLLTATASAETLTVWLDALRPANPQYARLMQAAGTYRDIVAAGGWPVAMPRLPLPTPKKPFRYKANFKRYPDGVVRLIKERLAGERMYTGEVNNAWDDALTEAVVRYRRNNGMEAEAYIDYEMTRAMAVPAAFRLAQIHLNLRRLRASNFGKDPYTVYVNVPAFEGELWDGGARKLAFRTIVGNRRKARHKKTREWEARDATPLFSHKMETVVMAPYWTVPASIRAQLMRRAEKDPDFLKREGYEVVGVAKGKLLRQGPGKNNALGRVKFLFPNEHDIYLHDTPDHWLFTQPMRAYSHGCIRVEKPLDLALYLLQRQDPSWTMRKLERRGSASVETAVTLDDGPTVHLEYITVTVSDDGDVRFHWDIYHHDSRSIEEEKGIVYKGDLYYP